MMKVDLVVIGGGAAGLASALEAYDKDIKTLVIEKEESLGGILNQCIHNGFGLHVFKEELTGPEYASRFIDLFIEKKIDFMLNSTVIDIKKENEFQLTVSSEKNGILLIRCKAIIYSAGCYEKTRGQIMLPGDRLKGIMPAGSAQRYLNIDGYLVGKNIFILGSGDIGLIMARRMTLEGANVLGVAEIMSYSNGLNRNIHQCLNDFNIPLYLSHTVTDVKGKDVLEEITIEEVDQNQQIIPNTKKVFKVDTLLLSVGLIPDITLFNHLPLKLDSVTKSAIVNQNLETSIEGLFFCGNALHVHDLVDWVTIEAKHAGISARNYIKKTKKEEKLEKEILFNEHIRYIVPQVIDLLSIDNDIELSFRVSKKINQGIIKLYKDDQLIFSKKRNYLAPAEMEKLKLSKDLLLDFKGNLKLILEEITI
jgi:NADPH-dependent 2,4-dienoyl-CoA reductase/sulfur reductase-like enzyme